MAAKKRYLFRYLLIAVVFCTVCVIYLGRLFYVQISGRDNTYDADTTMRVKVQAVRGEIYDRNGVALVSNKYTYDLTLSYLELSSVGVSEANRTYLRLLEALDVCGARDTHTEKYFPFNGTYPNYEFSPESQDPNSTVNYRLLRMLKDKGMKEDATAQELVDELIDSYRLLETDEHGNRLYTDYEVDRLIRLHYDMDALQFSASNDYTFCEQADLALMTYVQELGLPGVEFRVTAERVYNFPGYASHILGTVGPIYAEEWDYYNEQGYQMNATVGKSGCEAAFEEYLHGTDGEWLITLDAAGNIVHTEVITPPVSGNDVYLTIDINLQIAAEDALKENVEYVQENDGGAVPEFPCDAGAAVAMDPETFEILALASYPTYDLTTYNRDYNTLLADAARPLSNRALRETYAPGSTFKLGVAIAGLTEGVIGSDWTYPCTGIYTRFDDYQPRCSTWPHGVSRVTLTKAIADSCNCFFYELGYQLGISRLDEYMAAMGFGRETGIELGEETGVLAGESGTTVWNPGNTIQAAIGQSDTRATPLQLCAYICTIANGGTRLSAHLLHRVVAFGTGEVVYSDEVLRSSPLSQVSISSDVQNQVFAGMKQMVSDSNTVRRFLSQSGVSYSTVGGKTGTAQLDRYLTDEATGETTRYQITNALFVGVAPVENPELVISVVIEKASSGSYASLTAARIIGAWEDLRDAAAAASDPDVS